MRSPRTRFIVVCAVIFVIGVGVGVAAALLPKYLRGEPGLTFVARVAQLLPGTYEVKKEDEISSATDLQPLTTFWEVREQIKRNFVHGIDAEEEKQLTYGAVRGMLKALDDPYTRFMTPEDYKEFNVENAGQFDGIGAELTMRKDDKTGVDKVIITAPIPGGPAEKAGILAGDVIIKVDDKPIQDLTLPEVVKRIRGQRGTEVKLTVIREDQPKPIDKAIVRDKIEIPSLESKILEGKIGYIWLRRFDRLTEPRLHEAIAQLQQQGMKGLLLDLSINPGGLLDSAVRVGGMFVSGPVVWIEERGAEPHPMNAEPGQQIDPKLPIVVLINEASASASEIVAGAIQDDKRGLVVGQKSFGKGKVQTVIELNDGSALAITTANYLTPLKRNIDEKGITPDRVLEKPKEGDEKLTMTAYHEQQLAQAIDVMKKDLAQRAGAEASQPAGG